MMTDETLRDAILRHLTFSLGKDADHATIYDWRMALSYAVRDEIVPAWFGATRATYGGRHKRVYYLSMEFLIGRLLQDAMVNTGLMNDAEKAMSGLGISLADVLGNEPDAALGNGGLGRLAACFMESLATLGCPAYGYGIRYEHGLFRQRFEDGKQMEDPEDWLRLPNPWEFHRPEASFSIGFGGDVKEVGHRAIWTPATEVGADAHDMPVIGWKGRWANTLRLWGALPPQIFDLPRFNAGDYAGAAEAEAMARTISRVLYPDDTTPAGKELRLKQEFFFTAASLRDILRRYETEGGDLAHLSNRVAIQLNDTHPAIAGPELVRLLVDEKGMAFEPAVQTAQACLNYTNHTLLPEALERWSEDLMSSLLPRHMQLIERIDDMHAKANPTRKVSVVGDGEVRMGELSFIMANRVNGVSALHTGLMKETVFADLHRLHPDRIINQTNGITPRRWMVSCNPRLSSLVTDHIGTGWEDDLERLTEMEPHFETPGVLDQVAAIKAANKADFAGWLSDTHGMQIDQSALFDVQIKRIHEYKRQHLMILETIAAWQAIHDDPNADWTPRVKIFGGKAAPGYVFAKEIIHLINDVADRLAADPKTRDLLRVVYIPNYNVSVAERLIPASDLSEQISTAGKEASGTGNMKFALNGALTVGTLDGANVEIREHVGAENFHLFGMTAPEVVARREIPDHAAKAIAADPRLAGALKSIGNGVFGKGEHGSIVENVSNHDYFLVSSDFTDYWRAQREIDTAYADTADWTRRAALNIARSGWFSSDRTISGYMADVWDAKPVKPASMKAAE